MYFFHQQDQENRIHEIKLIPHFDRISDQIIFINRAALSMTRLREISAYQQRHSKTRANT